MKTKEGKNQPGDPDKCAESPGSATRQLPAYSTEGFYSGDKNVSSDAISLFFREAHSVETQTHRYVML